MRRTGLWARILLVLSLLILIVGGGCLALASPLALGLIDDQGSRDWGQLSEIGQTYGAVSALISVVALGGVAASLMLQVRSAQLDREHAYRSVHLQLIEMAFESPELLECLGFRVASSEVDRRQNLYCNQLYLALEMGYGVGALDEERLRVSVREILAGPGRRWWGEIREVKAASIRSRRARRVFHIVDEQWRLAVAAPEAG
jgi:hypothetical protein